MRLFRFLFYCFALFIGILFGFVCNKQYPIPQKIVVTKPISKENLVEMPLPTGRDSLVTLGKQLFKQNCASCHNKNMKDDLTGPALGGVTTRWADYPTEDLYNWIRNSQQMISEGHPRAKVLWGEWSPYIMNSFPELDNSEIDAILSYVEAVNH